MFEAMIWTHPRPAVPRPQLHRRTAPRGSGRSGHWRAPVRTLPTRSSVSKYTNPVPLSRSPVMRISRPRRAPAAEAWITGNSNPRWKTPSPLLSRNRRWGSPAAVARTAGVGCSRDRRTCTAWRRKPLRSALTAWCSRTGAGNAAMARCPPTRRRRWTSRCCGRRCTRGAET